MPRFQFRLQRVLNLKEQKEQAIKEELAWLKKKEWEKQQEIQSMKETLRGCEEALLKKEEEPFYIHDILFYLAYREKLCNEIKREEEKLQNLQKEIEDTRERLIAASKEKRVLQRLRERRWLQYVEECEKEEQGILDEVGISMHFRGANKLSYRSV